MTVQNIIRSARDNLARAQQRAAASELPDAGWRWASYCESLQQEIANFTDAAAVIHRVQTPATNAGYEARMVGDALAAHARIMEDNCRLLFPQFASQLGSFSESAASYPETVCEIGGRLVSSALYNLILHTMQCLTTLRPARVLEIGGGYGSPARVWMTNGIHRPRQYIDVDLPESLFYA